MRSCHQHLRVNIAHFVINLSIADSASSALYVRESSPQPCPPHHPTPHPQSNPVNTRSQFCSLIKNALCVCGRKRAFVRATPDQTAVVLTWDLSWICAMTHPPGSRRVCPPQYPSHHHPAPVALHFNHVADTIFSVGASFFRLL